MLSAHIRQSQFATLLLTLGFLSNSGCLVKRVQWSEPDYVAPQVGLFESQDGSDSVEQLYATALEQEQHCLESCVDLFFEVAVATSQHQGSALADCRQRRLHKSALNKLVVTGQRYGRLDPRFGLLVYRCGQPSLIPIAHRGFVWQPSDFHTLIPVGKYTTNGLRRLHRCEGVGVPLVVTGCWPDDGTIVSRRPTFAATLWMNVGSSDLVRSQQGHGQGHGAPTSCQLELCDPLRQDTALVHGKVVGIAKDLSAPLAYRLRSDPQTILDDFINRESTTGDTELRALEPYQAGKIPVVFIHGLLANPYTWADMVNELQAHPGFIDHFQIWVVEYPTGRPFLTTAAECRKQLRTARQILDPANADVQLSNMVLVGHSMGGLVAKLQVTSSGDRLWRSVANRPLHQIAVPADVRQRLADAFFFEPSPDVARIVFIGTPHRGSGLANRFIGRLGSALVEEPEDLVREHEQMIACNPGVFSEEISRRIPTSIDLLNPDSALLNAIAELPAKRKVNMHSVVGDSCLTLMSGKSDGVVSVKSARDHRAISERFIHTRHTFLTQHPETVQELLCILQQHLHSCHPHVETAAISDRTITTGIRRAAEMIDEGI